MTATNTDLLALENTLLNEGFAERGNTRTFYFTKRQRETIAAALRTVATQEAENARLREAIKQADDHLERMGYIDVKKFKPRKILNAALTTQEKP